MADKVVVEKSFPAKIGGFAWDIFCVVGPIIQYYPTLSDIFSLSPLVIFILLTSNIIRIFYWFADPFETPLVLQSMVMIGMQMLLLKELTTQLTKQVKDKRREKVTIFNTSPTSIEHFWKWTDHQSYTIYLTTLLSVLSVGYLFFNEHKWYGALLGYLALLIEACLGLPQVYQNYTKGCVGASPVLFLTWLAGDVAKTIAFIATGAPLPFVACGMLQTMTDFVIIGQIVFVNYIQKRPTPVAQPAKQD